MQSLWGAAFLGIALAGFVGWTLAIARWRAGEPFVRWNDRRPVAWALIDLLIFGFIFLIVSVLAGALLGAFGWPVEKADEALSLGEERVKALAIAVVPLVVLLIGLPVLAVRSGADLADLGWSAAHLSGDLRLGLIAFVMLAPPVFALQAMLVQFWPSEHPLMEMFKRTPDSTLFGLLIVAAVIVAPVFEELVFRVLLQGFLEKAVSFRGEAWQLLLGEKAPSRESQVVEAEIVPGAEDGEVIGEADEVKPYAPPTVLRASLAGETMPLNGLAAYMPIAISSIVFALLHWQHGPDWIPLTLLAAGMGYVYQRTHRIVPSLVVHMALNGFSMWGLWVQVRQSS